MGEVKKNSVLIVDDEVAGIMALTHILRPEYIVYAAKNGQDAIETATEHMPDVILLDILMPGMDGYKVIAELKNFDKTRAIPVIFVTGLSNAEDEAKGLYLGAADYISKPFSAPIVKLRVQNQIRILNYINMIENLCLVDQLMGVPNRRAIDERLRLEWGRAIRLKTPLSILVLDLDNFKRYNDTYGHMQGDAALQATARILTLELKRTIDFVGRWGGEEFLALLPDTNGSVALDLAARMRAGVENALIPLANGKTTRITVSIGINSQVPKPEDLIADFIQRTDEALYTAKEEGRNRVCRYDR